MMLYSYRLTNVQQCCKWNFLTIQTHHCAVDEVCFHCCLLQSATSSTPNTCGKDRRGSVMSEYFLGHRSGTPSWVINLIINRRNSFSYLYSTCILHAKVTQIHIKDIYYWNHMYLLNVNKGIGSRCTYLWL